MKIASIDVFVLGFPFKSVFVLAGGVAGDATALSHWKGQRTLQVLETDAGRSDACWEVPLTGT